MCIVLVTAISFFVQIPITYAPGSGLKFLQSPHDLVSEIRYGSRSFENNAPVSSDKGISIRLNLKLKSPSAVGHTGYESYFVLKFFENQWATFSPTIAMKINTNLREINVFTKFNQ